MVHVESMLTSNHDKRRQLPTFVCPPFTILVSTIIPISTKENTKMATYINCTCGDPYCDGNGPQCYHPYNQVQGAPDIEVVTVPDPVYGSLTSWPAGIPRPVGYPPAAYPGVEYVPAAYPPVGPRYPPVRGDLYRRRRGSRTPDDDAAVQLALLQSTEDFGGSSDYSSPYTPLDSPISRSPLRGGEDDFEEQLRRAISESEREAARARRTRRNPPSARQHPRRYPTPPATADDYEQQLQRALEESARDAAPPPRIRPSEPAAHHPRYESPPRRGGGPQKTCSICMEDFPASECARLLPCQHDDFCVPCITMMCRGDTPKTCPLCRVPFHQYQNGRQIVDSRMRR